MPHTENVRSHPRNITIGGISTLRATRAELAALMVSDCSLSHDGRMPFPRIVVSSNGLVIANYHLKPSFRNLLRQADIVDADGMPLVIASRFLCKKPLEERTATTDFIHDAAAAAAECGISFFFLGGKLEVAHEAAVALSRRHPGLNIVGTRHGYFTPEEEEAICADIVTRKTDVLWVGLGSPHQEAFAARNRSRLSGVAWIRTCGGLFDHMSGRFRRAPNWMQRSGLEWIYRTIQEPRRLGPRYLTTNPVAAYHLLTKTHD